MLNKKGTIKNSLVLPVWILIGMVALGFGWFLYSDSKTTQSSVTTQQNIIDATSLATAKCPAKDIDVQLSFRNALAKSSDEFMGLNYAIVSPDGKTVYKEGTGKSGTSRSDTTDTVGCSPAMLTDGVKVLVKGNQTNEGYQSETINMKGATAITKEISVEKILPINITLRDSGGVGRSMLVGGTHFNATEMYAMSDGTSLTRDIEFAQLNANSKFGGQKIIYGFDGTSGQVFNNDAFSLSVSKGDFNIVAIDCSTYPSFVDYYAVDKCFSSRAVYTSDGTIEGSFTLQNNGGSDATQTLGAFPVLHLLPVTTALDRGTVLTDIINSNNVVMGLGANVTFSTS